MNLHKVAASQWFPRLWAPRGKIHRLGVWQVSVIYGFAENKGREKGVAHERNLTLKRLDEFLSIRIFINFWSLEFSALSWIPFLQRSFTDCVQCSTFGRTRVKNPIKTRILHTNDPLATASDTNALCALQALLCVVLFMAWKKLLKVMSKVVFFFALSISDLWTLCNRRGEIKSKHFIANLNFFFFVVESFYTTVNVNLRLQRRPLKSF